jgi:SulP family sulfate permease
MAANTYFKYSWGAARSDLTAGATVAAIAVPQAIAYALIAGVDPRYGLHSGIVITIVASIFGSSSHLINGPTNAISLVVFSALASFDGHFDAYEALFLLGIMAGTIQILIAVFKLGNLTRYVSESVILGFMAAFSLPSVRLVTLSEPQKKEPATNPYSSARGSRFPKAHSTYGPSP